MIQAVALNKEQATVAQCLVLRLQDQAVHGLEHRKYFY